LDARPLEGVYQAADLGALITDGVERGLQRGVSLCSKAEAGRGSPAILT
jgi:hypothetical protein